MTGLSPFPADEICLATENELGIYAVGFKNPADGFEWTTDCGPMRAASLIKLFIMAELFEQINNNRIHSGESLVFQEQDRVAGSGLLQELPAGTSCTILELVELMITESDNIATNLLIDRIGQSRINERIQALGCPDTVLRRRMMDFSAAAAGRENLTSVQDVVRLVEQLYNRNCQEPASVSSMCAIMGRQKDRCKIPQLLPDSVICQHKTGELPGAEHDAGIIRTPAGDYILAIMSDNLPDPERGRQVIARISRIIYDWYMGLQ